MARRRAGCERSDVALASWDEAGSAPTGSCAMPTRSPRAGSSACACLASPGIDAIAGFRRLLAEH